VASLLDPLDVPSQYYDPKRKGFVSIHGSMTPQYRSQIEEGFWESPFGKILGSSLNFMLPDRVVGAMRGKIDPYTGEVPILRDEDKVEISAALLPQSAVTAGIAKMGAVPLLVGGVSGFLPKVGTLLSRKGKKGFASIMPGMSYTSWEKKYGNKAVENLPDNLKDFAKIIYYYKSFGQAGARTIGETWKTNTEMLRRAFQGYYDRAISLKNDRGNLIIPKRAYPDIMKLGGVVGGQRYIAHRHKNTVSGELVKNNIDVFSELLQDISSIKHTPGTQVGGSVLKSIKDTLSRWEPEILNADISDTSLPEFLRAKLLKHGIEAGDEVTDAASWYKARDDIYQKAHLEIPNVRGPRSGSLERGQGQGVNLMRRVIEKEFSRLGVEIPSPNDMVKFFARPQFNQLPKQTRDELAYSFGPEQKMLRESGIITPNLHHGLFLKNAPNLRGGMQPQSMFWAEGRPFDATYDRPLSHGIIHSRESGLLGEAEAGGRSKIKELGGADIRDVAAEVYDHQKRLAEQGVDYWSPYGDRRKMPGIYRSILEMNPSLHEANLIRAKRLKKQGFR